MKKTVTVTTFNPTLILACLSVVAQTQFRDDVIKEIEAKRAGLAVLEKTKHLALTRCGELNLYGMVEA